MVRSLPLYIVDAFSNKPFAGNGAAVCLVPFGQEIFSDVMQKIAAEMKLSETAFVTPVEKHVTFENGTQFYLRWFTPECEVALCGHATLASAAVLLNVCNNPSESIQFQTQSGKLVARKDQGSRICIDLPSIVTGNVIPEGFSSLLKAIVGDLPVQDVMLSGTRKLLIRLADNVTRKQLEELTPDSKELMTTPVAHEVRGAIVTLAATGDSNSVSDTGERYDFISRYFAPWVGILEDPVTGSAHAVLGPYWSKVLKKNTLFARQCSARGGELRIELVGDRVLIKGDSVIVLKGELNF